MLCAKQNAANARMGDVLSNETGVQAEAKITRGQIAAAVMGNALEFYDFTTYALFAVQIGKVFFPSHTPFQNLMLSLLTFAVGFVARPIGADRPGGLSATGLGRRPAMLVSFTADGRGDRRAWCSRRATPRSGPRPPCCW